ncbi:hypothetical protein BC831DRAFT_153070 [Entophlyctis helioformis]|nr:hypothetical protein BC831DRAFT_153070 [Entophlyctis helioformis]
MDRQFMPCDNDGAIAVRRSSVPGAAIRTPEFWLVGDDELVRVHSAASYSLSGSPPEHTDRVALIRHLTVSHLLHAVKAADVDRTPLLSVSQQPLQPDPPAVTESMDIDDATGSSSSTAAPASESGVQPSVVQTGLNDPMGITQDMLPDANLTTERLDVLRELVRNIIDSQLTVAFKLPAFPSQNTIKSMLTLSDTASIMSLDVQGSQPLPRNKDDYTDQQIANALGRLAKKT